MNYRIIIKLLIILSISLISISCLEVETTINISTNLSGTWILKYRIMQEASFITPGTELRGYNYLPVSEKELQNRIAEIQGLDLVSFNSETSIIYTEYLVEMKFDNTDNIQFFFNSYVDNVFLNINLEDEGNFVMLLNNPFPDAADTDTLNLISSLYSDKNLNITIRLPGIVTETYPGLLVENPSEANLNLTIPELFNMTVPVKWIIKYE